MPFYLSDAVIASACPVLTVVDLLCRPNHQWLILDLIVTSAWVSILVLTQAETQTLSLTLNSFRLLILILKLIPITETHRWSVHSRPHPDEPGVCALVHDAFCESVRVCLYLCLHL